MPFPIAFHILKPFFLGLKLLSTSLQDWINMLAPRILALKVSESATKAIHSFSTSSLWQKALRWIFVYPICSMVLEYYTNICPNQITQFCRSIYQHHGAYGICLLTEVWISPSIFDIFTSRSTLLFSGHEDCHRDCRFWGSNCLIFPWSSMQFLCLLMV